MQNHLSLLIITSIIINLRFCLYVCVINHFIKLYKLSKKDNLVILDTQTIQPSFHQILRERNEHEADNKSLIAFKMRVCLFILYYMKGGQQHHLKNIKGFALTLLIIQITIIVLYGVFVRHQNNSDEGLNSSRYPAYQDVNVMMLIGFGFLMAFSKSFSWSAIGYTFFMNAMIPQLYVLLSAFWKRVLVEGFHGHNYYIYVNESTFTLGLYCAASMFVSIGCTIGRVGPLQAVILSLVHSVVYTLNEVICVDLIGGFDVGGSTTIHTFGAYAGLVTSLILSRMSKPTKKPHTSYNSNMFAFIGTLFLWIFWPSFNFGVFAKTSFAKTQIISNTIISLVGSCLATFMTSAFLKSKFTMEHILNATLSGGVVIGAAAGLIINPGGSLLIGFTTGIISTLGFQFLTPSLQKNIGLFDTCGVHNLHGIPGLLGGLVSAAVAASYALSSSVDAFTPTVTQFPQITTLMSTPYHQAALQVAITFCSLGLGIVTALIGGVFIKCLYDFTPQQFFTDAVYFEQADYLLAVKPITNDTFTTEQKFSEILLYTNEKTVPT